MNRMTKVLATGSVLAPLALGCGRDAATDPNTQTTRGTFSVMATAEVGAEAICNAITPEQKERFGIDRVEWKSSADRIPFPHCEILSSVAKSGAVFSIGNKLIDFNQNIPTAAISR